MKYLCDCESSLQTYNRVMPREVSSKIVDIPELVRTTLKAAVARRGVFETITKKQCGKTPLPFGWEPNTDEYLVQHSKI